jgi:hypothetical protein
MTATGRNGAAAMSFLQSGLSLLQPNPAGCPSQSFRVKKPAPRHALSHCLGMRWGVDCGSTDDNEMINIAAI